MKNFTYMISKILFFEEGSRLNNVYKYDQIGKLRKDERSSNVPIKDTNS